MNKLIYNTYDGMRIKLIGTECEVNKVMKNIIHRDREIQLFEQEVQYRFNKLNKRLNWVRDFN